MKTDRLFVEKAMLVEGDKKLFV